LRGKLLKKLPQSPKDLLNITTHAQFGEDRIVEMLLHYMFDRNNAISYVEIGSNEPTLYNNTYYFYRRGGQGLLVDPNPIFKEITKKLRPRDIFLNVGISFSGEKSATYYDFGRALSGWNTFSKKTADSRNAPTPYRSIELSLVDVNDVLAEHFSNREIDFMSIDVEGLDMEIIKRMDWQKYRPKVFMTEIDHSQDGYIDSLNRFMELKDYRYVAGSWINNIYVDTRLANFK
jgi:hypothetical protein